MADLEQMLKEIFGDSFNKVSQFQSDQMKRLNDKIQDIAREALKDEFAGLHTQINELRERLTVLEAERAEKAADRV
jgi:uncharacterized protein (DUF4213/DUF364 family)